MAISYVGGQTAGRAGNNGTTNVTFSFSGGSNTTPQAGDLVVVTIVVGSQARNPSQDISAQGYTVLTQQLANGTTYDTSMVVAYKRMGSTPDTTVTMPSTGNIADAQRWTIQCFRGVDATTPMDATAVPATGTGTGRPNPGSITPVTAGAWVTIHGGGSAGTGASYTAPANFTTNFLTGSTADTNDAMVGSGYWTGWTSGAVDPAQYTGGTTNAADSWAAYTLALRPQLAVTHDTDGDLVGQGSTVAGSAARFRAFATSGDLTAQGSTLSGAADRQDAPTFVTHDTTGALSGQGSAVVGAAANFTVHGTTGVLMGLGSTIAGAASSATTRPSSGVLVGLGSTITGSATRSRAFGSSGALVGQETVLDGSATRTGAPVSHDTTGFLIGPGAAISGQAETTGDQPQIIGGHYGAWWAKKYREMWERKPPTLQEVLEYVEEEPQEAMEVVREVAPAVLAPTVTAAQIEANQALQRVIAEQIIIAAKLRKIRIETEQDEDDIEAILLML